MAMVGMRDNDDSLVGREPSVQGVLIAGDGADTLTKVGVCQRLQSCSTSGRLTRSALEREASWEPRPGKLTPS